jgi:hypothetical protein
VWNEAKANHLHCDELEEPHTEMENNNKQSVLFFHLVIRRFFYNILSVCVCSKFPWASWIFLAAGSNSKSETFSNDQKMFSRRENIVFPPFRNFSRANNRPITIDCI